MSVSSFGSRSSSVSMKSQAVIDEIQKQRAAEAAAAAAESQQLRNQIAALTGRPTQTQQQQQQQHQKETELPQQPLQRQQNPGSYRKRQNTESLEGSSKDPKISNGDGESSNGDLHVGPHEDLPSNLVVVDFGITNHGHMRQEIEIGLISLNGNKFIGTITPQEAKFSIYRDCLGFVDFSNFDGVRFAFRGIPVVVFKLKTAINVDELIGLQNFEFKRSSTRQNKT